MNVADTNMVIGKLESRYLKNKAGETYLALEELNFQWTKQEVKDFNYLWQEGRTLEEMAGYFKRTQEEVLLLALDQGMNGKIQPREGGLIGG